MEIVTSRSHSLKQNLKFSNVQDALKKQIVNSHKFHITLNVIIIRVFYNTLFTVVLNQNFIMNKTKINHDVHFGKYFGTSVIR